MRIMLRKVRPVANQQGFSMAEVVMALILFSASVIGISGLVMTGASDVTRGATDSVAANLAAKRIEEVRSLPFYRPWDGSPQDIDDTFFNTSVEGDVNAQQLDHPKVVEDYGTIPGNSQFRRTTAIQYQQPSSGSMSVSVMASNWVPSSPAANQIDRPKNISGEAIHAMIIEVCVYYHITYGGTRHEVVYKQRALEGDMIVPGGASQAPLTVLSISPDWGPTSNTNLTMKVEVESSDSITQPGQTFEVKLWRAGSSDIVGTGTTVIGEREIDTHFNLSGTGVGLGLYNISVYWVQRGWLDKDLRNCFTVVPPNPIINSVDNFNWGTSEQNSRQVTIHGYNLKNPTSVSLLGPSAQTINGTVVSSNDTTCVVNFNLTSVPTNQQGVRWDTKVVGFGGSDVSNADVERVLMNPRPVVTGITGSDPQFYRKKKYTDVTVSGRYFGGVGGTLPTVKFVKSGQNDILTPNVVVGTVTETSDTSMTLTVSTLNLGLSSSPEGGPFTSGNSAAENGSWQVVVVNNDAQQSTENVTATVANAPIQIVEGWSTQQCWGWDLPLSVRGKYFDPDNTTVSFLDSTGNPYNPGDVQTVTDAGAPTGLYDGSEQIIPGALLNLIDIGPGTYKIRVRDTENNLYADRDITTAWMAPSIPSGIAPIYVTNGTTATLTVRAKGLYHNGCTYTIRFWYMEGGVHQPANDVYNTSTSGTLSFSRADKYTQIEASVNVPAGDNFMTINGALPEIQVTNQKGTSGFWTGGHPLVI
jgi:hypothetical protein